MFSVIKRNGALTQVTAGMDLETSGERNPTVRVKDEPFHTFLDARRSTSLGLPFIDQLPKTATFFLFPTGQPPNRSKGFHEVTGGMKCFGEECFTNCFLLSLLPSE